MTRRRRTLGVVRDAGRSHDELLRLADSLLEQAREVREGWAELNAAVEELAKELGLPAAEPLPRPVAAAPPAATLAPDDDPARLVATEMLLNGRSREEVDAFLRRQFGDRVADEIATSSLLGGGEAPTAAGPS